MHIVGLEVENYGRIKAVSLEPDETGAVVISGRNAQGKSSLLNAIWAALGGRGGNTATKPVREGADEARVTVDLGDMIVTRIWRNDTTALKVQSKDGAEYKSPQTLLDSFIGKLSFDPLAFTRLKDREQREALLELVDLDIDLDTLGKKRQDAYEKRTAIGQDRKRLGDVQVDQSLPTAEQNVADLIDRIQTAKNQERELDLLRDRIKSRVREREEHQAQIAALQSLVKDIDTEIGELRHEEASTPEPENTDPLMEKLNRIDETNAAIRENNSKRATAEQAQILDQRYEELGARIAAFDRDKAAVLARASFPVDGLGFDAEGVTFNGTPFSQASSAEQIRVSMAMAIAANPKLKVVRIMDGSLLDDDGMKIITNLAAENSFQVWIERVANGDGVGFVIEDGELTNTDTEGVEA